MNACALANANENACGGGEISSADSTSCEFALKPFTRSNWRRGTVPEIRGRRPLAFYLLFSFEVVVGVAARRVGELNMV